MKKDFLKLLAIIAILVLIGCLLAAIIGAIGAMKLSDGCLMRYSDADSSGFSTDQITKTILLKANANYTGVSSTASDGSVVLSLDPHHYGEWVNTRLSVNSNYTNHESTDSTTPQKIDITIKGKVSLCGAYLPKNNFLQPLLNQDLNSSNNSDLDINNNRVLIPRVEDVNSDPLVMWLDAQNGTWRNIAELYPNDEIIVALYRDSKQITDSNGNTIVDPQNVSYQNIFTKTIINADCSDGKNTYSPICGRYSIYQGTYVCGCTNNNNTWSNVICPAPANYQYNGNYTYQGSQQPSDSDLSALALNSCVASDGKSKSQYADQIMSSPAIPFWFSADSATGLLYRFDSSEEPTNASLEGSNFNYAAIQADQSTYNNNAKYQIIYEGTYGSNATQPAYLQYRLHDLDGAYADNTGGYVLNIKQTKCIRNNGAFSSDTFQNRGAVDYIIVPGGENPNSSGNNYNISTVIADSNGSASISIPTDQSAGDVWMKIRNQSTDYQDAMGQYTVKLVTYQPMNKFVLQVLDPLFEIFKGKVTGAAETIFKNMTCYDTTYANCTNFFNYIKSILTIYIILYAIMFLLGIVQITQEDIVIRIIKIGIVAGLMNQQTFEFFNNYVFNFVVNFSDQIISDIPGYNAFLATSKVSNPFSFLDSLMTQIFFSKTFMAQLLALLSMGLTGILYFVIVLIALMIIIITILRAVSVYLMAFMAIALLIGLAPLFLTFMLFDYTKYLFDNWVKFTIRYMIEPTVLLAGIIIMTQLFTIYLDFVIGYSVCWKCALSLKIPFPSIPGLSFAFTNVEIFCINWFAPWGLDFRSGMMGVNMQHIIALVMISYCIYGYTDLSGRIVSKLTGGIGANSSATKIGKTMSAAIEQKALKSVGLDKQSRSKIKEGIGQRIKQGMSNLNKSSDNKNNQSRSVSANQKESKSSSQDNNRRN